jgi:uncharacterized membrane protein
VRKDTKIAAAVFAAIPLAILSASTAMAWAIALGAPMRWRILFRLLCHGIPSRCLTLWEVPMPICARCTAIYAGLFAGLMLFLIVRKGREIVFRWPAIAAAILIALDGVTQATGLRESTNGLRIATGLLAGFFFGMWVLCAIETAPRERSQRLDAV